MERETVERAVKLFPRYMAGPGQGLATAAEVVGKLIRQGGEDPESESLLPNNQGRKQ